MRRNWFWIMMLAVGLVGCDTTPPPPPPGAEKAETELKIDEGGDQEGKTSDDSTPQKKSDDTVPPKDE